MLEPKAGAGSAVVVAGFADGAAELRSGKWTAAQVRRRLCRIEIECGRPGWPPLLFHTDPATSTLTVRSASPADDPSPARFAATLTVAAHLPCHFSSTAVSLDLEMNLDTGELTRLNLGETALLEAGEGAEIIRCQRFTALRHHEPHESDLFRSLGHRTLLFWEPRDQVLARPALRFHFLAPGDAGAWTPIFETSARLRGTLAAFGSRGAIPEDAPAIEIVQAPASLLQPSDQEPFDAPPCETAWYVALRNLPYAWGQTIWNDLIGEITRPGELDPLHAAVFSPLLDQPSSPGPGRAAPDERRWQLVLKVESEGAGGAAIASSNRQAPVLPRCHSLQLAAATAQSVGVRFPLLLDTAGVAVRVTLPLQPPAAQWPRISPVESSIAEPGLTLDVGPAVLSAPSRQTLRVGSLDLHLASRAPKQGATPSRLNFVLAPVAAGGRYAWERTRVDLSWAVAGATPGGQDPLPGAIYVECDEDGDHPEACADRREPPLVIPWPRRFHGPADAAEAKLLLTVKQRSSRLDQQRIELKLAVLDRDPDSDADAVLPPPPADALLAACDDRAGTLDGAVVLDREPFLVAKVSFPRLGMLDDPATDGEVARWQNYEPNAAVWNLRFSQGRGFCLTLPPQAVGETLEKGHDLEEHQPADFRLSPPASLAMRQSYFQQTLAAAPWNLRELLGNSGRELPGAQLDHLQFELLYGLSCRIDYPAMRLAELSALVGDVQGPLPSKPVWRPLAPPASPPPSAAAGGKDVATRALATYQETRQDWRATRRRTRQRLGIFEIWDIARLDTLELATGVTCWIRHSPLRAETQDPTPGPAELLPWPEADLADPFAAAVAVGSPSAAPACEAPLAGGATWGFESRNIYQAVMRPGPDGSWPRSNTAAANDVRLSALGAYGHQMAAFDHFRTKILADAAMGRTWSYTLERIGRIGVWWNRAKHVIVYERTVLPSAQFSGDQDALAGRAVVRKVEEYVELLENNRTYPDKAGSQPRATGFVAACTFSQDPNQVVRFPVRGAWGSDVGAIGWKVPLWQPGADADIYPWPRVDLTVYASSGGASVPRQVTIADPENLVFYTDTQPPPKDQEDTNVDLSNSDAWAPVEGIDFCDEGLPQPAGAPSFGGGGALRAASAGDSTLPAGLRPCTFLLEASEHAVDLLAHRPGDPMGAALSSLTLCRAQLSKPSPLSQAMSALRADAMAAIETHLGALPAQASQLDPAQWSNLAGVCDDLDRAATQAAANLRGDLQKAQAKLKAAGKDAAALVAGLDTEAAARIAAGVEQLAAFPAHLVASPTLKSQLKDEIATFAGQARLLPAGAAYLSSVQAALQLAIRQIAAARQPLAAIAAIAAMAAMAAPAEQGAANLTAGMLANLSRLLSAALAAFSAIVERLRALAETGPSWSPDPAGAAPRPAFGPDANAAGQARNLQLGIAARWVVGLLDRRSFDDTLDLLQATLANVESLRLQTSDGLRALVAARLVTLAGRRDALVAQLQALQGLAAKTQTLLDKAAQEQAAGIEQFAQGLQAQIDAAPLENLRLAWDSALRQGGDDLRRALAAGVNRLQAANKTFLAAAEVLPVDAAGEPAIHSLLDEQCATWRDRVAALAAELSNSLTAPGDAGARLAEVRAFFERQRDAFAARLDGELGQGVRIARQVLDQIEHTPSDALSLVRAFGQPPNVSGLAFDRPEIAFFFDPANDLLGVTPVVARAAQEVAAAAGLKPFGVALPVVQIGTQLIPAALQNFDLASILPNIAGISLGGLFANLKMPASASAALDDHIQVKHGLDPQTRQAWVSVTADFDIPGAQKLFACGPLAVQIDTPRFHAETRIEGGAAQGATGPATPVSRHVRGSLTGDWTLQVGGCDLIAFKATRLEFDEAGQLHFQIEPRNVRLSQALEFINALLTSISPGGVTTRFDGDGVVSTLDLPIPDTQLGAFGFSGLRLGSSLALRFGGDAGFNIGVSAALARRDAPFTLTIFILGGAGYLELGSRYFPATGRVAATADLAIAASASLAIALGPIQGGVAVYVGVTASYDSSQGGGLAVGLLFMIRGSVSVLGIASATIVLALTGKYQGGALVGTGSLDISIKICWCYTLEVHQSVTYSLGSAGSASGTAGALREPQPAARLAQLGGGVPAGLAPVDAALAGLEPAALVRSIDHYFSLLASCS